MSELGLERLVARGYMAKRQSIVERARALRLHECLARLISRRAKRKGSALTVLTDAAGTLVEANAFAARWLNVAAERLIGKCLLHFVARGDTGTFRAFLRGLGYPNADRVATVRFRPRQGHPQLVHASVEKVGPDRFAWMLRSMR